MQNDVPLQTLSHEQFLIVTLIVKLAVTAVLATMLARFRIFRAILLTERRDWPQRLVFAAGFGIPLVAGEVILSGSLVPLEPVRTGDFMSAHAHGLGEICVRFV